MTASIEEFLSPHATPQRPDAKFLFANQENMRKNITRPPLKRRNIMPFFQ